MNLKELRERFEEHVNSVSIEQFERELLEAGIENCPDMQEIPMLKLEELIMTAQTEGCKVYWGASMYKQRVQGIEMESYVGRFA